MINKKIMKIEELIKLTILEHPCPRILENANLSIKYETFAQKQGVSFMETYSTSVFPRLVSNIQKQEYCLVWDNHFWDLYQHFLLAIKEIELNRMNDITSYDFFASVYNIFLCTKFYRQPFLSLVFAKYYAATGFFVPPYYIENAITHNLDLHDATRCLRYCKDFVFFHEIHHALYQQQKEEKILNFAFIRQECEILKKSSLPQETQDLIQNFLNMSDEVLLEELCCDVNSICSVCYLFSNNGSYSKDITEDIIKSIRLITLFINNLKRMEIVYNQYPKTKDFDALSESNTFKNSIIEKEIRNYVVFFIARKLMGFYTDFNSDSDFFLNDNMFYQHYRPYSDILHPDHIEKVYTEAKFYSKNFSPSECSIARDIIIGWHKR